MRRDEASPNETQITILRMNPLWLITCEGKYTKTPLRIIGRETWWRQASGVQAFSKMVISKN